LRQLLQKRFNPAFKRFNCFSTLASFQHSEEAGVMAQTIYEKYGGFGTVNRIVMSFYDRLLDHDELGDYFEDIDMKSLIDHQTKFISSLLGGPVSFDNDHLQRAHAHLNISSEDFDEMKNVLAETLSDHGVVAADVDTVIGAVEARRGYVQAD
jgi:hemoglobin